MRYLPLDVKEQSINNQNNIIPCSVTLNIITYNRIQTRKLYGLGHGVAVTCIIS